MRLRQVIVRNVTTFRMEGHDFQKQYEKKIYEMKSTVC
jgi:hypothetical protein